MKLNNPMKFFPQDINDPSFHQSKYRSTILTRGDIFKKFAINDSIDENDWHFEKHPDDQWFKMSFDGGFSFPLKFKFNNKNDELVGVGIPSPTYSGFISAIPTVYDDQYKTCNILDNSIPSIETTTRLENVNVLKLKVVSTDEFIEGNVVLNFDCNSKKFTRTIIVEKTEKWVDIVLPHRLTGILSITRDFDNELDTLKDNGIIISCIITNITVGVE